MTDKDVARKIIEIIDAYESCDINPIEIIEKYCQQVIEKQESVIEDLDKAAIQICQKILEGETVVIDGYEYVVRSDAEECCKACAQWQFERIKEALLSEVLPYFMHGGEADEVVAKLDEVLNQKK